MRRQGSHCLKEELKRGRWESKQEPRHNQSEQRRKHTHTHKKKKKKEKKNKKSTTSTQLPQPSPARHQPHKRTADVSVFGVSPVLANTKMFPAVSIKLRMRKQQESATGTSKNKRLTHAYTHTPHTRTHAHAQHHVDAPCCVNAISQAVCQHILECGWLHNSPRCHCCLLLCFSCCFFALPSPGLLKRMEPL